MSHNRSKPSVPSAPPSPNNSASVGPTHHAESSASTPITARQPITRATVGNLPLSATTRNDPRYDPNVNRPAVGRLSRGRPGPGPRLTSAKLAEYRKTVARLPKSPPPFATGAGTQARRAAYAQSVLRITQSSASPLASEDESVESVSSPGNTSPHQTTDGLPVPIAAPTDGTRRNPDRRARGKLLPTSVSSLTATAPSRNAYSGDSEAASSAPSTPRRSRAASTPELPNKRKRGRRSRSGEGSGTPSVAGSIASALSISSTATSARSTPKRRRRSSATPLDPPSYYDWMAEQQLSMSSRRAAFLGRLETDLHLVPVPVRRDGNSLPDALAVLTTGIFSAEESSHMRVRLASYAHSREEVQAFIDARCDRPFPQWATDTLREDTWCSHVHILLAEEIFDVRINVYLADGELVPLPPGDTTPYQVIAHRPVRALLLDAATRHYQPLVPLTGAERIADVHTQLLATARRHLWRACCLPVDLQPRHASHRDAPSGDTLVPPVTVPQPPDVTLPPLNQRPISRKLAAAIASAPELTAPLPVYTPTEADRQLPLYTADDLVPSVHAAVPSQPPADAPTVANLRYPHDAAQVVNFQRGTLLLPALLLQCFQLIVSPAPPDAIVLAVGRGPGMFPSSWEALALCDLAAYQLIAETDAGITLRLIQSLWFGHSGPGPARDAPWPVFTTLPSRSPWYLRYVPPPDLASMVPPIPTSVQQPRDLDNLGVTQYKDNLGLVYTLTKSQYPRAVKRMEHVSVFAGTGRLPALLQKVGFFAYNLVHSIILPAAIREYVAAQTVANPHNLYPQVPVYDLAWYRHRESDDLCTRVICFEFVSFTELPDTVGLRLAHFLPTDTAVTLADGALTHRDHWLRALEGVGATYGVLYAAAFEVQFTALVADIRRHQLGVSLSPLFVEALLINRLAAFYSFASALDVWFELPSDPNLHRPRDLTPQRWSSLMRGDILHALRAATEVHDLVFTRNLGSGPTIPPPTGLRTTTRRSDSSAPRPSPAAPSHSRPTQPAQGSASPAVRSVLCVPDLLRHYGLEVAGCPRGAQCTATHYDGVRGWPFHKAQVAVQAAKLSSTQEGSLLAKMEKDTRKFPSPGSSSRSSSSSKGRSPSHAQPARKK
jgi:hypothetical protein